MSSCWDVTGLTHTQKIVLLSLADQSNDDGVCWPSASSTAKRVSLCERATRKAIAELESLGHLSRHFQTGKATYYKIHPCMICTPAQDAPLHHDSLTPAPRLTDPCTTTQYNHKEPSIIINNNNTTQKQVAIKKPKPAALEILAGVDGLSQQVAEDFLAVRKAKRAPLTATALALIASEAGKAGITTAQAIAIATARGWQSFKAEWVKSDDGKTYAERTQDFHDQQAKKHYRTLSTMTDDERKAWGFA
jgi:hypothetical protein